MRTLIKNFKSTNVWKAFVLNSIAATLIIFIAITVKGSLESYTNDNDPETNNIKVKMTALDVIIILLSTFTTAMIAYSLMYFIFGFGGGMLIAT